MSTLIIGDTHLTHRFDPKLYKALRSLFQKHDSIILNGDFWDGYQTSFDKFVNSEWSKLFPLLKKKKTLYLYGNHDDLQYSDARVCFFSYKQKCSHKLKITKKTYLIQHGHQVGASFDLRHKTLTQVGKKIYPLFHNLLHSDTPVFSHLYRKYIRRQGKLVVNQYDNYVANAIAMKRDYYYIFSHVHKQYKHPDLPYTIIGDSMYRNLQYVVLSNNSIKLHKQSIRI